MNLLCALPVGCDPAEGRYAANGRKTAPVKLTRSSLALQIMSPAANA
jgi:hypothetical protein